MCGRRRNHAHPGEQEESALTDFIRWLRTPEASAWHAWLVGWEAPLISRQVQVSRLGVGETWDELRVPPLFNSVFIFRSVGAPHGVTQVTPDAGSRFRYTVTTFLLAPG